MVRWGMILGIALMVGCGGSKPRVVLYCAQDQEFAEQSLGEFTHRTGLQVAPKYDTEADKSVSLYLELLKEKNRPPEETEDEIRQNRRKEYLKWYLSSKK